MLEFIKNNKWKIIISCVLILLPMAAGLILWDKLPTEMPVHWGVNGEVDGYAGKGFVVFEMPAILLAMQLFAIFITSLDRRNRAQNKKVFSLIFFIVPFVSLYVFTMMYSWVLGFSFDVGTISLMCVGLLLAAIGNYLPKCKQNFYVGIRLPWTLENEANWNATHRLAGKIWVIGGATLIFAGLLPGIAKAVAAVLIIGVMVIMPFIYSYRFYKNHDCAGRNDK